jgi:tetratricopeptide (TPR) repeat protein
LGSINNFISSKSFVGTSPANILRQSERGILEGKSVMVDLACNSLSKPFVLKEEFTEDGDYWEAKDKNLLGIHSRIQVWDNKGLASVVHLYRGLEIKKPEKTKDALSFFAKAIDLNPKYTLAYVNRGLAYSRLGQHAAALADASKAVELDPKSSEAYCCRGYAYFFAEKITDALPEFDKSLSINPKHVHAYYGRGAAYSKSGQYAEAMADFDKSIEIDPKFANGYYGRGRTEISLGKLDEAKKDLLKAVELEPEMKEHIKAISDHYSLDIFPPVL